MCSFINLDQSSMVHSNHSGKCKRPERGGGGRGARAVAYGTEG